MKAKKGIFFSLIFLVFCISNTMENNPDNVVIDFNQLFKPNIIKATQKIGPASLIHAWACSWFGGSDPKNLVPDFFKALEAITPEQQSPYKIIWQNQEAPYLVYESLITHDSHAILDRVRTGLKTQNPTNLEMLLKLADITFNPEDNAGIMESDNQLEQLIYDLKMHGKTVHLLGNCNKETTEILKKTHSHLFNTINGTTLLSGEIAIPKSPEMYRKFFETTQLQPEEAIFIESQQQHINDLLELKIKHHALLALEGKVENTRKYLVKLGYLPS